MQRLSKAVAMAVWAIAVSAHAQTTQPAADTGSLYGVAEALAQARRDGDVATLARLMSEDYLVIDGLGRIQGRDDHLNEIAVSGVKIEPVRSIEQMVITRDGTAVISGVYTLTGTLNRQDVSGLCRYVDTYARQDGRWFAVASTTVPVVEPGSTAAAADPANSIRQSRQLWREAITAEGQADWRTAVARYEAIRALPPVAWPAALERHLGAARRQAER